MRIGIITQHLDLNYGGLLQNYALQTILKRMGHDVYTINRTDIPEIYVSSISQKTRFSINQIIKRLLCRPSYMLYQEYIHIRKKCIDFVHRNINLTEIFKNQEELLRIINEYDFEGYIVGSDQVWRPCYSLNIYNDFLDFCQDKKNIKRIAYGASFGVNEWEFDDEKTNKCSHLLKLFDAVSVREDSGMELCEKYLGVSASHVLDPTLLLEKEDYIKLVEENSEPQSSGDLFCYILDNSESIESAICKIEKEMSLTAFQVKAKRNNLECLSWKNINDYIVPSPISWLRAFMDAKMVFTDSFHGCVFSIIFNKPFWVIGNKGRGNARFDSLLKLFDLEDRRIDINVLDGIDFHASIDWDRVKFRLLELRKMSMGFLQSALNTNR